MHSLFWTNTIWYIGLAAESVAALLVFLKKAQNRWFTAAFWLGVLGFTYILEVVLVIGFNAYQYHPGLVSDSFQDTVLGNIFSQVSVSTSAVLIAVFGLSWLWRVGFSVVYFLIDILFSTLGIYQHLWYRSVYTLLGFFIYSWVIKWWYGILQSGKHARLLNATWFLGAFATLGNTIILPQKLLRLQIFVIHIFANVSKDHTTGILIYEPLLIITMIAYHSRAEHQNGKWVPFVLIAILQYALFAEGVILIKPGWFAFVTTLDVLGAYMWTCFLGKGLKAIRT